MGFLKGLGEGAGWLVGGVTGGIIKGIGEATGSKFIQEVGDGVKQSTEFAGKQLGNVAEGVWNVGSGLISKDEEKIDQGFGDLGEGIGNTASAVGKGITQTVKNVGSVAGGLIDGDETRWKEGARNLGKTAAIGALGVSVLDFADIVDVNGAESDAVEHTSSTASDLDEAHADHHFVQPHERTLASGQTIWVDGDGDTSADRTAEQGGGFIQSNPGSLQDDASENENNPGNHYVHPHERTLASGRTIWVDGDGDSTIDHTAEQGGGWVQSNPDRSVSNT
ncbi:hypothetical protein LRR81_10250 [Metabacillus sp. GX 13764]|uniref:hypothetical protein n=1 Tax=Metabacillus kandeliae TaxID=2900151 RepID=UPI001E35366B|nr:hypothetical protein [Metabacillus kandeliae]MCD7034622.1 hypothetical protein [Metabacillus kandeliae]